MNNYVEVEFEMKQHFVYLHINWKNVLEEKVVSCKKVSPNQNVL